MANVAKGYGVGDTVYVWYHGAASPTRYTALSRVVQSVDTNTAGNSANVKFTNGDSVVDGTPVRVFTSAALCSTAIVTEVIAASAAAVALDVTLSGASTSGAASSTLVRSS